MKDKSKFLESMLGWASLGFLVLWVLEIRRVAFKDSYWLIMLCLACLLGFQYMRYKRGAEPLIKNIPEPKKPVIKPSIKKKNK